MSVSPKDRERILVVSVNWLGDAVMALPALQRLRDQHPDARIDLVTKPVLRDFWAMHAAPDEVLVVPEEKGAKAAFRRALRASGYDRALILPNSFRSGWLVWRAGVPQRRGTRMHGRGWMINDPVSLDDLASAHQAREFARILGVSEDDLPAPKLDAPTPALDRQAQWLGSDAQAGARIVLLPGAARGPSKQWPEAHWVALIQALHAQVPACRFLLGGTPGDVALCQQIAESVPDARTTVVAGQTSLQEFAWLLAQADTVVANDSGGMHVAAALGVSVVAIYGITDPAKTGPLGSRSVVVQHAKERSRDIPRECPVAAAALASVKPEEIAEAVQRALETTHE